MEGWIGNEEERCRISFDPNNGEGEWYMTVPKGTMAAKPADPKMYGGTFFGWFDRSGDPWMFGNCVTEDLHLRAKWTEGSENGRIVMFDTNKGGPSWSVSVPKGSKVSCPEDPCRHGWDFGGWFLGDAQWDFEDCVNDNITLTARWMAVDIEDEDQEMSSTALTLMAAFILITRLIRRPKVTGIVSQNGKGLEDIEIRYAVDGTEAAVVTDSFGRYVIPVSIGSEIEIVSVDGRGLTRDFSVKVQKKLTEVNIRV